ncbi:hypothetical protein MUN46_004810 [Mesosutterella sp. AGMB02718]|uniref:Uncharacterized protein n=1 Tax=Mesosutterella faecium TaxID=2925194 RepID=A0ABT7IMY9_9BURK|nr:hypothetical protein [Mesosutterella sp. AGMB02718]MDL2059253.1 hypothetical protein [Mesosutterella sp. AGMB02718]
MAENKYPETLEGFKAAYRFMLPPEQQKIDPLERTFNLYLAYSWALCWDTPEGRNLFTGGANAALGLETPEALDRLSGNIGAVNAFSSDLLKAVRIIGTLEKTAPGAIPETIPKELCYRLLVLAQNLVDYGRMLTTLLDAIRSPSDWRCKAS